MIKNMPIGDVNENESSSLELPVNLFFKKSRDMETPFKVMQISSVCARTNY